MDKVALLSLASDLKRITQSIQRKAKRNTQIFNKEAKKWLKTAKKNSNPAILRLLNSVDTVLKQKDDLKKAEDCLMYSVILQNRALLEK